VGTPHGRASESFSLVFPLADNLLAMPSRVDRSGHLAVGLGPTLAEARPPAANQMVRDHRRWDVCLSDKSGELVGKTNKGKGTNASGSNAGG
jgi:hypothetical protein